MDFNEFVNLPCGTRVYSSEHGCGTVRHTVRNGRRIDWNENHTYCTMTDITDFSEHAVSFKNLNLSLIHVLAYCGHVPTGYEFTGVVREPMPKEHYIGTDGKVYQAGTGPLGPRVIVRSTWKPPTWIKTGCWIFSNDGKHWFVSPERPQSCNQGYVDDKAQLISDVLRVIDKEFVVPQWTDAKNSLVEIK